MQGNPNGWPDYAQQQLQQLQQQHPQGAPPHVDTPFYPHVEPMPPEHKGDTDNDAQWTGIAVVGGGVVFTVGLFVWLAVTNREQHAVLEDKIEGVDSRLLDYQQAHAIVHSVLQAQITAMQGHHAPSAPPQTLYGTPAGYPAFVPPVSMPAQLPAHAMSTIPPQYGQYAPPAYVPASYTPALASIAPPPMAPPSQRPTFVLPKHLEGAVASAARESSRAAKRASNIPTRLGV